MFWRDLDVRVCKHLSATVQKAVLVAPFIKVAALQPLMGAVPPAAGLRIYTRWRVEEVAAGVSDPQVLDLIDARPGASLHLCDELHAKLFLIDGSSALIGSANITAAALGLSPHPNLEVLQATDVAPTTAALFLADLDSRSRPATRADAERILANAEALRSRTPLEAAAPPDAQDVDAPAVQAWFPSFRSPDRLYNLSQDVEWITRAIPSEPALRDLLALAPPLDAGEAAFDIHIGQCLRSSPIILSLEAFLAEPQRFGALTDWLRSVQFEATHQERQVAGQTLIRWLTYFASDRYEVVTPGAYSEVLRIRT